MEHAWITDFLSSLATLWLDCSFLFHPHRKLCPAMSWASHRVRYCRLGSRLPSSRFCALCLALTKMPAPHVLPRKHMNAGPWPSIYLMTLFITASVTIGLPD